MLSSFILIDWLGKKLPIYNRNRVLFNIDFLVFICHITSIMIGEKKLRVACLHGYGTNAKFL